MSSVPIWISLLVLCISLVNATPVAKEFDNSQNEVENSYDSDIGSITKCSLDGGFSSLVNCAATRALKLIQQVSRSETINIFPGVSLISDNKMTQRDAKAISIEDLPENPTEKVDKLFDLFINSAVRFFSGRSLKITIPEIAPINVARALEEGRAKSKKSVSPLFLGIAAKVLLLKTLALGVLKFMSIKALILSKIALIVAAVLASQSLFGKNNGMIPYFGGQGWNSGWSGNSGPSYGAPNYPGWTTNSIGGWTNSQYPYARSINEDRVESRTEAQDLAYSNQKS
ncbi:hypothetical protein RN001_011990 [Aquatica leii]|uniref:Uncharacterized protein n=1 Tax=Aquatica leii TaxID=1421715 RepID=A0AAN7QED9_9COLE|nr:hypothetical protein RN001_011990 [Aquatica leii]